jgi:uncharacterized sulfatase
MVEHVDQSVGRIMRKLDELGLSQETIVVFFSDNGGLTRKFDGKGVDVTTNAPLRDEKGTLYEGGIRVPLIIRWPEKVGAGTTSDVPVSSVDFWPTFLSAAEISTSEDLLDGESLLPLLKQSGKLSRDALYWHYPHYHHSTPAGAIRVANWKLIEFFEDGRLELYDLARDPGETKDLSAERKKKAQELREKLNQWRTDVGAELPIENPEFDAARRNDRGRVPRE